MAEKRTIAEIKSDYDIARRQGNVFEFLKRVLAYPTGSDGYIQILKAVLSKLGEMTSAEKAHVVAQLELPNEFGVKKSNIEKIKALHKELNKSLSLEKRTLEAFWDCRTIEDMKREWGKAKEVKQDESFILFASTNPFDFRRVKGFFKHDSFLVARFLREIADELSENHLRVIEQLYEYPPPLPVPENIGLCHAIGKGLIRSPSFDTAMRGMEYGVNPLKVEGANAKLVEIISLYIKTKHGTSAKRRRTD